LQHTLYTWACIYFDMNEDHAIIFEICTNEKIFICDFIVIMNVCEGQLYMLYCDAMSSFQSDAFSFFHGLL
jgi:hypothetical protein